MASKLNVNLTDLQSLVVDPTLLARTTTHETRLDNHDTSLNTIFSTAVQTTGATFTGNVTIQGNLDVAGATTNIYNVDVSDNLIALNKGLSTRSATRDSGILIQRGSDASNVFMGFDESTAKFTMGTTTSEPTSVGNMENFTVSTLLANLEGKIVSGDVSGGTLDVSYGTLTTSTAQKKAIVEGVGSSLDLSGTDLSLNKLAAIDLSVNSLTTASFAPNAINISAGTLTTSTAQNLAIFKSGVGANDANVDIGTHSLIALTLRSDATTGVSPLQVTSTTQVANLHASQVTGDVTVGTDKTLNVSDGTLTTSAAQKKAIVEGVGSSLDLNATDLSVNNLAAIDLSVNSLTVSQLTSALDGIVGGNTPAAGTFTALTANDSLTVNAGASIIGDTTDEVTLNVKGVADQTANLLNVENSAGSSKLVVDKDGLTTAAAMTVTGNLTVNGTTTTVHSVAMTVSDPIMTLGGNAADSKDRGVEYRYNDGSAKIGFFGMDTSATGKPFVYVPNATNNSEVISGDLGPAKFSSLTLSQADDGTAPMTVTSTTQVANLHASQVTGSVSGSGSSTLSTGTGAVALNGDVTVKGEIDTASAAALELGKATATSVALGAADINTISLGPLTVLQGAGKGVDTTSAGVLELGASTANAVNVGKSGSATTVKGTFNVDEGATFDSTVGITGELTATSIISTSLAAEEVAVNSLVCHKSQLFTDADITVNGDPTAFADGDVIVELGALDVTGLSGATHIVIKNAYIQVTGTTGEVHVGNLSLSATTGTAANSAVAGPTEIVGAGVTGQSDIDLNTTGVTTVNNIGITAGLTLKNLYLVTTTAISANNGNTLGVKVLVDYDLIKL